MEKAIEEKHKRWNGKSTEVVLNALSGTDEIINDSL